MTKNAPTVAITSATNAATGNRVTAVPPPRSAPRRSWKASRPRGSAAHSMTRMLPPWQTTSAGSWPGAWMSSSAAVTRSLLLEQRLAAGESELRPAAPPGGVAARARSRCDLVEQVALPRPRQPSRRRASRRGSRPIRAPTISAVSRARRQVGGPQRARSRRRRRRSASSRAWRRPVSFSGVSREALEAQRLELSSVSPWRASRIWPCARPGRRRLIDARTRCRRAARAGSSPARARRRGRCCRG